MQMVHEDRFHIRATNAQGQPFYSCHKYDGGKYDRQLFTAVLYALLRSAPLADRESAWEALSMKVGSGDADFDITQILYYTRHFTLLAVAEDGTFVETHPNYVVDAQTEHSLWMQHQLEYVDHAPVIPPQTRRTGRVRRRTGVSRIPRAP